MRWRQYESRKTNNFFFLAFERKYCVHCCVRRDQNKMFIIFILHSTALYRIHTNELYIFWSVKGDSLECRKPHIYDGMRRYSFSLVMATTTIVDSNASIPFTISDQKKKKEKSSECLLAYFLVFQLYLRFFFSSP